MSGLSDAFMPHRPARSEHHMPQIRTLADAELWIVRLNEMLLIERQERRELAQQIRDLRRSSLTRRWFRV